MGNLLTTNHTYDELIYPELAPLAIPNDVCVIIACQSIDAWNGLWAANRAINKALRKVDAWALFTYLNVEHRMIYGGGRIVNKTRYIKHDILPVQATPWPSHKIAHGVMILTTRNFEGDITKQTVSHRRYGREIQKDYADFTNYRHSESMMLCFVQHGESRRYHKGDLVGRKWYRYGTRVMSPHGEIMCAVGVATGAVVAAIGLVMGAFKLIGYISQW